MSGLVDRCDGRTIGSIPQSGLAIFGEILVDNGLAAFRGWDVVCGPSFRLGPEDQLASLLVQEPMAKFPAHAMIVDREPIYRQETDGTRRADEETVGELWSADAIWTLTIGDIGMIKLRLRGSIAVIQSDKERGKDEEV